MEGEERHIYEPIRRDTIQKDNVYELQHIYVNEDKRVKQPRGKVKSSNKKHSTKWSPPFIVHTALLCLILILHLIILCLVVVNMTGRDTATCTSSITAGSTTGSISSHNFTEWADTIASKVNTNVTQSLPNFNEWANGVAHNTFQLIQNYPNFTEPDEQILQTTRDSAQKLVNIVNTLSNLQDTSTSTTGVVDDILLVVQELLVLHNDSTALPTSCKEVKERLPNSPSGVYLLANTSTT